MLLVPYTYVRIRTSSVAGLAGLAATRTHTKSPLVSVRDKIHRRMREKKNAHHISIADKSQLIVDNVQVVFPFVLGPFEFFSQQLLPILSNNNYPFP